MQNQEQPVSGSAAASMPSLDIHPLSDALGGEVRGMDLATLDEPTIQAVRRAWLDHIVLLFRDQSLSDGDLVAFSRHFGDLDEAPPNENGTGGVDAFPEIIVLSNVKENGKPIGALGNGEAIWHSDMNYIEEPAAGSVLHALEVPPNGGDTGFCNMYAALDALPATLRTQLDGLRIKHDSSTNSAGFLRQGSEPVTDLTTCPGAVHPIVRTHPESGRKALYLGRRRHAYVMGLPLEESETLLDEIWSHATQKAFSWHHRWRVGDVLMWDNRCAMHRRDAFDPRSRRIMHRTQIKGDRPF